VYSDEVANVVKLIQNCKYDKALSEAEKALYRATKELGRNHPDLVVYLDLWQEFMKRKVNTAR